MIEEMRGRLDRDEGTSSQLAEKMTALNEKIESNIQRISTEESESRALNDKVSTLPRLLRSRSPFNYRAFYVWMINSRTLLASVILTAGNSNA